MVAQILTAYLEIYLPIYQTEVLRIYTAVVSNYYSNSTINTINSVIYIGLFAIRFMFNR